MPNRLARETSPYLKQHQNNPVDWYSWGEEALKKARDEKKPILLSVGYSACHWCHVMEHESFENEATARLMNEHFVSIKVDREERPDLDQIYQNVAQIFTRGGGWPLTVFLTPDLRPFFGGTYFPPEDRYGRPGFPRVLQALAEAFRSDPASIEENAIRITEMIRSLEAPIESGTETLAPTESALREAAARLVAEVDWESGGIGGAPKFPNPMMLSFLLRLQGDERAREAALLTMEKMMRGGIFDQLGGGFHRYSVDATWSVPHFEKMLYDNGLLLKLYAEALLFGSLSNERRELFRDGLAQTVGYLLREMRAPSGAFYSAQDADSEGEEGKFFVWTPAELGTLLEPKELAAFATRFGVTEAGNFEHGSTVLFQAATLEETAARIGATVGDVGSWLRSGQAKILAAREKRIRPGLDDKVLTAWNALLVSGLAWAARALREELPAVSSAARDAAEQAYAFLHRELTWGEKNERLYGTHPAKHNGYLDDYAFLAWAALDLARFEPVEKGRARVEDARRLTRSILEFFADPERPGFFFTSQDHEALLQRPKAIHDQAIPSGTSVAIECMLALAEISPDQNAELASVAQSQLARIFPAAAKNAFGFGELLCACCLAARGPVVVSGDEAPAHPHAFRSLAEGPELLVCHRQTCSVPLANREAFLREAFSKI